MPAANARHSERVNVAVPASGAALLRTSTKSPAVRTSAQSGALPHFVLLRYSLVISMAENLTAARRKVWGPAWLGSPA
jgi:hypothetical protein